ncbi:MAG: regulatory protein RecX [Clostridia bacterium]|nr:regulatory protein RecX [Clostridia bacterium]
MSFDEAKEKAVRYLVVAKKTEFEVMNKLKKLNCEEDIAEQVIAYLNKINYLNDKEYVDAYIRQCMRLLNYSIYEIKQKLLQKGIKKCIIEEKLAKLSETNYEKEVVQKLLNGKLKQMEELKQKQYLYRRGFKYNCDND